MSNSVFEATDLSTDAQEGPATTVTGTCRYPHRGTCGGNSAETSQAMLRNIPNKFSQARPGPCPADSLGREQTEIYTLECS